MRYTDHRTQHPVPLNQTQILPCQCLMQRRDTGDGGWCYIYFTTRQCPRGDHRRVGQIWCRSAWLAHDAGEAEIRAAIERCAEREN